MSDDANAAATAEQGSAELGSAPSGVQRFSVHGRVTERGTADALPGARVELWKHGAQDRPVEVAETDAAGRFRVRCGGTAAGGPGGEDGAPTLYLKVFRGGELVHTTEGVAPADGETAEFPVVVEPAAHAATGPASVDDLLEAAGVPVDDDARARLAGLAGEGGPAGHAFWSRLREDEQAAPLADAVRGAERLLRAAGGDLAAVREIRALQTDAPAPLALAALDADGWRALAARVLARRGAPSGVAVSEGVAEAGAKDGDEAERLAKALERAAATTYPAAFLAQRLASASTAPVAVTHAGDADRADADRADAAARARGEGDGPAADDPARPAPAEARGEAASAARGARTDPLRDPVRERVAEVLRAAPEADLAIVPVARLMENEGATALAGAGEEERGAVAATLRRLQRVLQVAPYPGHTLALLADGLDSAAAIARVGRGAFVSTYGAALGGDDEAARVHGQARGVTTAATQLFTTVHQAVNDVAPRVLGGDALAASLAGRLPDWASLFGRTAACDCPECRSVYSPAAYLVDLLRFLDPPEEGRPLDVLLERRPDLAHLRLTCENTGTPLPYVDLVNEVLESYVALGATQSSETTGAASADALSVHREYGPSFPESISDAAYATLRQAVYPLSLPFDRSLETVRAYLAHLGTSRWEIMAATRPDPSTVPGAEYLRLPPGVSEAFAPTRPLQEYFGYTTPYLTLPGVMAWYWDNTEMEGPPVAWRVDPGISFQWGTGTPLPGLTGEAFSVNWYGELRMPVSPYEDQEYTFSVVTKDGFRLDANGTPMIDAWTDHEEPALYTSDPWYAGSGGWYGFSATYYRRSGTGEVSLGASTYGASLYPLPPANFRCHLDWRQHLTQVPEFLDRTGLSFVELMELLATRAVNPDPAAPRVRLQVYGAPDDVGLMRVRGIETDDAALGAIHRFLRLWRALGVSMGEVDRLLAGAGNDLPAALDWLGEVRRLQDALSETFGTRATADELRLLWEDFDPWTQGALYASLFGNRAVFSPLDPDFRIEGGEVVGTESLLDGKTPLLSAALRVAPAELAALRADAGLGAGTATLSLANLSALYRRALLGRVLRLPAAELVTLRTLTGAQPFHAPAATLDFAERVREVRESGFTLPRLAYLFLDQAGPAAGLRPPASAWTSLVKAIRTGLAAIAEATALADDADGTRLRELLGAELGAEDGATAMAVIDRTPDLTEAERNAFVSSRLAFLPEQVRAQLAVSPVSPANTLPARRAAVLAALLARRRDAAGRAHVSQSVAAALGTDQATTALLLEQLLRSGNDAQRPAISDFLALDGPGSGDGLLGTYFATGDLQQPLLARVDPRIEFSWGAGAPHPDMGDTFSIRWTGQVLAEHTETYTFRTSFDDAVRLWVDGQLLVDEWHERKGVLSGSIDLQAGRLYDVRLEFRESWGHAHVILLWSSPSTPQQVVPQRCLLSGEGTGAEVPARRTFARMHKLADVVTRLGIPADEMRYAAAHTSDFGGVEPNQLPVDRTPDAAEARRLFTWWRRLRELAALRRTLPPSDTTLLDVFAAARAPQATMDGVLDALAAATGWDAAALADACGADALGLQPASFVNAAALPRVHALLRLSARTGAPVARLAAWGRAVPDSGQAAEVRDTAKSRHDEASWVRVAAPISDGLRDRQREALVACVLNRPQIRAAGVTDADGLFEHFLIDVQMGTCMRTSRIKQAISSVQLFVQRSLLDLEPRVPPSRIDATQWEWMKSYRVWEANRKVFLYPENWIEPELRDDKTPFFRELETGLLQSEVTHETAEAAVLGYLERLSEVSRLEIVATCVEEPGDTLHVFGRTYETPHRYFSRRRQDGRWTPWERLDADIQGDHLIPVMHNGRLHLFWSVWEQKTDAGVRANDDGDQPYVWWNLKLAWSAYRPGRGWSAKEVSGAGLRVEMISHGGWNRLAAPDEHTFRTAVRRGQLVLRAFWRGPYWLQEDGFDREEATELGYFEVPADGGAVRPVKTGTRLNLLVARNAGVKGMLLSKMPLGTSALVVQRQVAGATQPAQLLGRTPTPFSIAYPHQREQFALGDTYPPFFVQDRELTREYMPEGGRTFLVTRSPTDSFKLQFSIHQHPQASHLVRALNTGGVDALLTPESQRITEDPYGYRFGFQYQPSLAWVQEYPLEDMDFTDEGAYAAYNWELFFHAPVLVADRLCREGRYAEAQRWMHYVFDPVSDSPGGSSARYWKFRPFHENREEQRIQALLEALASPGGDPVVREWMRQQVAAWRRNPFQPHRIARMRWGAYQKSVVMKYLDNLVAWGDSLFARDTLESINEATQLYVLAAGILGPRPERIPEMAAPAPATYAQLRASLDEFGNAMVEMQNRFPQLVTFVDGDDGEGPTEAGIGGGLYFGIPRNDRLLAYWDTVADRLAKIRSCRNLEGVARSLALFEPPIDPGALVRAGAQGGSLGTVLQDVNAPLGAYRFTFLLPKAVELSAEVRSLGGVLLSALEKRDAEALGMMRAEQETGVLRLVRQVREQAVAEARANLDALRRTRQVVEARDGFYSAVQYMNARETEHLERLDRAQDLQEISQVTELAASVAALLPTVQIGVSGLASPVAIGDWGGINLAGALQAASRGFSFLASVQSYQGSRAATLGAWDRRRDEWKLQAEMATRELAQVDQQIAAAEVRLQMAERELANHDRQVENAAAVEAFLRGKFTGPELYGWMVSQVSALYFQVYQLAYAAAKRAERAYRFERGLTGSGFVQFGHWDSLRKGLLAGERLHLELKRMEMAYLDGHAREHELVKHVSLALHDPLALMSLKETGRCHVRIPEAAFDLDHPGHYMRRLRSVSVTVPCVTGPYTGINARLTLLSSRIRVDATASGAYAEQENDPRFLVDFASSQSIATSHAQNDAGLFELSFRDERYLPFEGAGAVSEWRLELPRETNAFDFDTITDVVLRVSYTAREGGDLLRTAALNAAILPPAAAQPGAWGGPDVPAQENLYRTFSARHEFADEWRRFLHAGPAGPRQRLRLGLAPERFPYRFRGRAVEVGEMELFLRLRDDVRYPEGTGLRVYLRAPGASLDVPAGEADPQGTFRADPALEGIPHATVDVSATAKGYGDWVAELASDDVQMLPEALRTSVTVDGQTFYRLNPDAVEDLAIVCRYTAGPRP